MKLIYNLLAAFCLFVLPATTFAHGFWIEADGSHNVNEPVSIKLYYGDYGMGEKMTGKALDKIKDISVSVVMADGSTLPVSMKQLEGYWEGSFTPATEGTYEITGTNDVREVQDWTKHDLGIVRPIQYLKTVYTVGNNASTAKGHLFIDVVAEPKGNGVYELKILKDGKALPSVTHVLASFNDGEKAVKTDGEGKATITLNKPGVHILSVEWIDKTPGEFKQKKYETVRHRLDMSLYN